MKYYLLREESDPKIIGVKDGVAQVEIDESGFVNKELYQSLVAFFNAFTYWQKEDFAPPENFVIECARPLKGAVLTDFLTYKPHLMACPFMISERIKQLFEIYNLQEHYYFQVKLYYNDELIRNQYYLMYCPYLDYRIVDFSKSSFYTGSELLGKKKITFNNKNEYLEFLKINPLLQQEQIILTEEFDKNLDLFLPRIGGKLVSERLKQRIIEEGFTGIKILGDKGPVFESV